MDNKQIQLAANSNPDHIIGYRNNQAITLKALCQRAYMWKTYLEKREESKFALYIEDTLEFIAVLVAGLQAGKTFYLPSNPLPATAESLVKYVDGFIGLFPQEFSPVLLPMIGTDESDPAVKLAVEKLKEVFVFTSGSTGEPQAIPKRISQLITEVQILERTFGNNLHNQKLYATVSHNHIYGLLFKVFWPLYTDRPIQAESLNWPEELAAVSEKGNFILVSSPAHLKRFAQSDLLGSVKGKITAIFSSGAPLDRETALSIAQLLGHAPYEVYGSSETGGIAWRQRTAGNPESWTPLKGVQWRINQENSTLEIQSPHLYDSNWLQMADIIVPEGENRFLLKGRVDRIVKIEEKRVSLTAIEKALLASSLVKDSKVILVDMPETKRQRSAAFVVLNAEGKRFILGNGRLALNRFLRQKLSTAFEPVTLPKIWRYIDALPINSQGKTTYADLLALLKQENDD